MDVIQQSPQTGRKSDYEYRRVRAFQSITNGTVTNLMLLLDGINDDLKKKLLTSRSDHNIVLRRPSTARNFTIQNPTLLACACAEWYMEIVEFLATQDHGLAETVSVKDESNDIVNYSGVSPLCIATITGKFKMVQILVDNQADINHQNSIGNTALFEACFEGHISIVNYLVQKGASIELANHKKITCLMIASYANNWEITKLLTNLGANVNKRDKNNRNALFYCLPCGSVAIFKLLRQSGATLTSDAQGMTVLMEAAYYGQLDMVKWLVKNRVELGLDANEFDNKGRNVLFYSAEAGDVDVFQYLISSGVAIHPALDGSTVLMVAALRGRHTLMDYFHENSSQLGLSFNTKDKRGRNCLFYAVSGGEVPMFSKLINYGAKVECTSNGVNLLQQAAVKGEENFGKYLLDHVEELGLDIQGRDQDGWNALFFAIASGNLNLFKMIHERGVTSDRAMDGRTLLMQAALRGHLELIRHILGSQEQYQSDINAQDNFGRSALYMSLQSDSFEEVFKFLLDRGAVNHKTKYDSNILMETTKVTNNVNVIKMLVNMKDRLGISLDDLDCDGRNVLFYAAQNRKREVMEYLLTLGIAPVSDVNGRTILMTSAENGHLEIVELLTQRHREIFLDIEHRDSDGRNVLFYTLERGHLSCFRAVIDAGVNCTSDNANVTLLMVLAGKAHGEFLEFVVKMRNTLKIDIQAKDNKGDAAIHFALASKMYDNLLYLIDNGADLLVSGEGESVVSTCVDSGVFWVVEKLATSGVDLTEDLNRKDADGIPYFHRLLNSGIDDGLMIALIEMYYDERTDSDENGVTMVMKLAGDEKRLLRHLVEITNVDLNNRDSEGRNALYYAASACCLPNVKYLLSFGAKFENDFKNRTGLMASSAGSKSSLNCLIHLLMFIFRDDASRHALDSQGRSVLHYAVESGNVKCVKLVLKYGLDMNLKDNEGLTPLLLAAQLNHADVVDILADKGADVNARDNQSKTALHLVFETEASTLAITKSLIGRGCDVNALDQSGRTPLMLAATKDNLRPIRCLLENGADAKLTDNDGHDALYYCPEDRHIIRVLIEKHKDDKMDGRKSKYTLDIKRLTSHLIAQTQHDGTRLNIQNGGCSENQSGVDDQVMPEPEMSDTATEELVAPVVAMVIKRSPNAYDKLCRKLKLEYSMNMTRPSYNAKEIYL